MNAKHPQNPEGTHGPQKESTYKCWGIQPRWAVPLMWPFSWLGGLKIPSSPEQLGPVLAGRTV